MKRFIFAVAVVMACLFSVGGALANTYTDHVTTAPNGKGDLLVYPVYMASEGIETKITVVNTSLTRSIVAKLSVRSMVYSQEVLDFLLYLSPTDMWTGVLKNVNKEPYMFSDDASGPVFPKTGQPLYAQSQMCAGDTNQYGYVQIIEAWSAELGAPPLKKSVIQNAYDQIKETDVFLPGDTVNTLAGSYMISVPSVNWEATDNAVVFKDYDSNRKLLVSKPTNLGLEAYNDIHELDASFNKEEIEMTYNSNDVDGATLHAFTFPTKQSKDMGGCTRTSKSPFFSNGAFQKAGYVEYNMRVVDWEENTTVDPDNPFSPVPEADVMVMPDELNFKAVTNNGVPFFKYGWMRYAIKNTPIAGKNLSDQDLTYTGAPVIPVVIDFNNGLSIRTGAWTDGIVTDGAGKPIPGYQYTTGTVETK